MTNLKVRPGILDEFSMATDARFDISMIQELRDVSPNSTFATIDFVHLCRKLVQKPTPGYQVDIRNGHRMAMERLITLGTSSRSFVDPLYI